MAKAKVTTKAKTKTTRKTTKTATTRAKPAAKTPAPRPRKVAAAAPAIGHASARGAKRPARPVLHGLWLSIPACKVGLALAMMGVDFDYRHVDLRAGAHRQPEFLARNRFGQVPVLEHEGHHVAQSNVILHYLADAYEQFLGGSVAEEIRVEEWLQWDQDRMSNLARLRSFKRFPSYAPHPEVVAFTEARAREVLDFLDRHLGTSRFIAGPRPTVADIAIFPTIALADEAGIEIARWPNIQAWTERFMKLPRAAHPYDVMPREDRIGGG